MLRHDSKSIIVDALCGRTGGGVDDEARAAEVVADDAVGLAAFYQVVRRMPFAAVEELSEEVAVAVEFGDGFELVLVVEGLDQDVVELFADSAVAAVEKVVDLSAVG